MRLRTGTENDRDFSETGPKVENQMLRQNTEVLSHPPMPLPQKRQAREVQGVKPKRSRG
jgi:hypothetical protein